MTKEKPKVEEKTKHVRDYYHYSRFIFDDQEAHDCWDLGLPVSDERRELIDRYIPKNIEDDIKDAIVKKMEALARVLAVVDPTNHRPTPTHTKPAPIKIKSAKKMPLNGDFEIVAVEPVSEVKKLANLISHYAAAAYTEGHLEGELWQAMKDAHARHLVRKGKLPARVVFSQNVIRAPRTMTFSARA